MTVICQIYVILYKLKVRESLTATLSLTDVEASTRKMKANEVARNVKFIELKESWRVTGICTAPHPPSESFHELFLRF